MKKGKIILLYAVVCTLAALVIIISSPREAGKPTATEHESWAGQPNLPNILRIYCAY